MPLSDTAVRAAKPSERPVKLFDGRGLFLLVTPAGGKLWRFKYRFADKEKLLALGKYPEITLKEARVRSDDARKLLAHAIDPGEQRKLGGNTFEVVARRWYALQKASLVESFAIKAIRSLEADAFPTIGGRPINDIKPPEVLAMLRKVEARGTLETLKRVRQRVAEVFTSARSGGIPAGIRSLAGWMLLLVFSWPATTPRSCP